MTTVNEELLRELHSSLCITFGTNAPFAIGRVTGERVGYASDPAVAIQVKVRDEDLSTLVPIVRQRVFAELAERGWENELIEFTPSVRRGRLLYFVDENEASRSKGKRKRGHDYTFHFWMKPELAKATFAGAGSFARIPNREAVTS